MMKNVVLSWVLWFAVGASLAAQVADLEKVKAAFSEANYTFALEESIKGIDASNPDSSVQCMYYAFAGLSSQGLEQNQQALGYYLKAIAFKVPVLDVYSKAAVLSKDMEDHASYEYVLTKQVEEFPDFKVDVMMKLVSHYYKTKQYGNLTKACDEVLLVYPDEVKYIYYKGLAAQQSGRKEEAKQFYRQVIVIDPEHKSANTALGVMLYKEASVLHKQETQKYEAIQKPSRVDYHDYMQRLEQAKEIHRASLPYLLKAYELKPSDNLKAVLKNTYKRLGEEDKANELE